MIQRHNVVLRQVQQDTVPGFYTVVNIYPPIGITYISGYKKVNE